MSRPPNRIHCNTTSSRDEYSEEDEGDGATIVVDDERIIYFSGDVAEHNVSQAIAAMFTMGRKDPKKPVTLVIETYGGSTDSMFSLYDAMKFMSCPVHTIAMGKVMSAGVLLLAAGTKGERRIAPHARVMTHLGWSYMAGNIFEMQHELDEFKRVEEQVYQALSIETDMTLSQVKKLHESRLDQYLSPRECIDMGIADDYLYKLPPVKPVVKSKSRKGNGSK